MQAIPFDPLDYPHPSRRTVVYARNGMTCAGNPTAASVGLQVLLKGPPFLFNNRFLERKHFTLGWFVAGLKLSLKLLNNPIVVADR